MKPANPLLLARYCAIVWLALLVYASLHPFSGWRDSGVSPFAFLEGEWPRYWTTFDILANVAVYVPLGLFLALGLSSLPGRFTGAIGASLLAAGVSFGLESLQTWLPARVPSNLDLAFNALGGLIGAIVAVMIGQRFFSVLSRWQHRLVAPLPHAELGLTLLGLWLLIPLSPEILLFGAGDVRDPLGLPAALPFEAGSFIRAEALVVASNMIAIGLFVRLMSASTLLAYGLVPLFILLGLAVRWLGAAILIGPGEALAWITPGVRHGLLGGALVLLLTLWMSAASRLILAALALMVATVVVNVAPANPYSLSALAVWQHGHFLNFNGLTRIVSIVWPFLALAFLMQSSRRE
ncbi:MAG TPA: VanZ family protein [Rhodocyclaceae bacterium]|nr:VanZ family protein [Rhodocyclaceae bacterium]